MTSAERTWPWCGVPVWTKGCSADASLTHVLGTVVGPARRAPEHHMAVPAPGRRAARSNRPWCGASRRTPRTSRTPDRRSRRGSSMGRRAQEFLRGARQVRTALPTDALRCHLFDQGIGFCFGRHVKTLHRSAIRSAQCRSRASATNHPGGAGSPECPFGMADRTGMAMVISRYNHPAGTCITVPHPQVGPPPAPRAASCRAPGCTGGA